MYENECLEVLKMFVLLDRSFVFLIIGKSAILKGCFSVLFLFDCLFVCCCCCCCCCFWGAGRYFFISLYIFNLKLAVILILSTLGINQNLSVIKTVEFIIILTTTKPKICRTVYYVSRFFRVFINIGLPYTGIAIRFKAIRECI